MSEKKSMKSGERRTAPGGIHRFAVILVGATIVLIFIGGLVTSTGSALAVPDWPLSFGKFFPKMEGGVLYEHGHRMAAGLVALLTAALAIWTFSSERYRSVRKLALAALGLVLIQAVLGGLTVLLLLPLALAVAHAATAQAFFCLVITLAVVTGSEWEYFPELSGANERPPLPLLAAVTTGIIYVQIVLGAVMRHMGAGLAIPDFPLSYGHWIAPNLEAGAVAINFAHRCGAVVVSIFIVWTVAWTLRFYRNEPLLRRPALGLLSLLIVQLTLGALTIWSHRAVLPTTLHVAVGAAVLGTSLYLALRARRMLGMGARAHVAADLRGREVAL